MAQTQTQNENGGKLTRITELRRRRKARRVRNVLLAVLAVLALAIYASGIYGRALAALGDLVESAAIGLRPGPGFPVKTGIADPLQVESLAGGFVELGSQDLAVFAANGNQLRSIAHNYARPVISCGNTRFALYNRSGYELRVEGRSRTLYTHTYQQPLILAEMSPGGNLAVVTDSSRYMAELTVYDPTFQQLYQWYPTEAEGMPVSVAFARDNRRFAVACLRAENGALSTNIYLLDLGSDDIAASISIPGSQPLQMHWLSGERLLVVCNDQTAVYDAATGEQQAVYRYGGETLQSASVSGQNTALLFLPEMADSPAPLVILDPQMQVLGQTNVPSPANGVVCTRTGAYVWRETSVAAYRLTGEAEWEMELETPPLAVLDAKKLLVFEGGTARELKAPEQTAEGA